jgi:hypothetical protein
MEGDLMRKFLMLAAVVGLALLVASPAMALDFKFGAEYRVRFYDGTNVTFNSDAANTSPRGVQIRVRPRFDVTDDNGNMTATLRLEIGDVEFGNGGGAHGVVAGGSAGNTSYQSVTAGSNRVGNGSGGSLGDDGVNVETKWAYVDFASPFGIPLRWRAGLQPWYTPKGIIIDDDIAGVRAYGKAGIVSYEVGWYRGSGGTSANAATSTVCKDNATGVLSAPLTGTTCAAGTTAVSTSVFGIQGANNPGTTNSTGPLNNTDNNLDYYQAKVDFAIAPWLNPGLYYIYGDQRASTANNSEPVKDHFLGFTVTGNANILTYDLDFVYGYAKGGPNGTYLENSGGSQASVRGWVVDGGVHIPVGPLLVHFVGSYATGDKQNGGRSEAMPWISPGWNGAGGLYEIVGNGGIFDAVEWTQDFPGGLWMLGGGVEYRPVKALWLKAMYGFIGFSGKRANCAYTNGIAATTSNCFGAAYTGKGYDPATGQGGIAGKSYLGQELSLRADYDLWTNFKIQSEVGWLFPSKGTVGGEYVLQLLYNF